MRIVYVCSLERFGPLTHLLDLAPTVAGLGPEVLVACASEAIADDFRARGVEAIALPLGHKFDLRGASRLWPALEGADVVHTHDRRAGLLARPLARLRGAAAVHTLHGVPNEIFGLVGRVDGRVEPDTSRVRAAWQLHGVVGMEAALARLGTTLVPSEALRQFLVAHGFPASTTRVLRYGVELRRREPAARHEPFRIATAATLQHRKGVDVLLEACSRVSTPLHLDVYGEGPLRSTLEAQADRLGVEAEFHGMVADVPERLGDTDLFALATRGDNLPVAVLEAMALALPVVTTRIGGMPELVENGESGFLVEPDDAPALAAAIERVAGDEDLRVRLGRASVARLEQRFDRARGARDLVALYAGLVTASP
jgi:glycosyltransferase involved in cell wall biosynthesis